MNLRAKSGSLAALAVVLLAATGAVAGEAEVSGFVAAAIRGYPLSPANAGQSGERLSASLILQPEFRYDWNNGRDRFTMIPFARLDSQDSNRTHADLREFNWQRMGRNWDFLAGVGKVFWGVTESRHLVDIVNQTDLVENIDGEDKLGQPMVNLGLHNGWGSLNVFVLPGFRERTFVGRRGRLRSTLSVDTDRAVYQGGASRSSVDLAVRYSKVLGDWDIGLGYFRGTGREPRLVAGVDSSGSAVLIPYYDRIDQGSLDIQVTKGDWLWKLEAMARGGQGRAFGAAVAGFEYTLYGFLGGRGDVGLLAEYLYDGRSADAPATSLDDDVFVGMRFTMNNVSDTSVLAGAIVDRTDGGTAVSLEADTRLNGNWTLGLEARSFLGLAAADPSYGLRRDHMLQLRLSRYF